MLHFSLTSKDRDKKASLHTSNPPRQWKMMCSLFEKIECRKFLQQSISGKISKTAINAKSTSSKCIFQGNNCRNSAGQLSGALGKDFSIALQQQRKRGGTEIPGEKYFSAAC